MIKPVGSQCNMHCAYCYYLPVNISGGKIMTEETLEVMIKNYLSNCGETASFVWHGGEPTLCGIPFFEKAVELQKKYRREGQQIWNNLQTNGLLLDDEWCSFLKKNSFDVGLSIDGTEAIHDHFRKDAGGNATYKRIRENILHLKTFGIRPDLLCTVNSETAKRPIEVYETLRDLGTGWIQFIPVLNKD
ncbi:MAG: radical SAM protein, partial [Clostridia bacterium]|nr:radical SAM protein [Clostridia bacterium]